MEHVTITFKHCLFHGVRLSDGSIYVPAQSTDKTYLYCERHEAKVRDRVDHLTQIHKDNPVVQAILQKYSTNTSCSKRNAYNLAITLRALRKL